MRKLRKQMTWDDFKNAVESLKAQDESLSADNILAEVRRLSDDKVGSSKVTILKFRRMLENGTDVQSNVRTFNPKAGDEIKLSINELLKPHIQAIVSEYIKSPENTTSLTNELTDLPDVIDFLGAGYDQALGIIWGGEKDLADLHEKLGQATEENTKIRESIDFLGGGYNKALALIGAADKNVATLHNLIGAMGIGYEMALRMIYDDGKDMAALHELWLDATNHLERIESLQTKVSELERQTIDLDTTNRKLVESLEKNQAMASDNRKLREFLTALTKPITDKTREMAGELGKDAQDLITHITIWADDIEVPEKVGAKKRQAKRKADVPVKKNAVESVTQSKTPEKTAQPPAKQGLLLIPDENESDEFDALPLETQKMIDDVLALKKEAVESKVKSILLPCGNSIYVSNADNFVRAKQLQGQGVNVSQAALQIDGVTKKTVYNWYKMNW
jgi:regulator of replication initiation timing